MVLALKTPERAECTFLEIISEDRNLHIWYLNFKRGLLLKERICFHKEHFFTLTVGPN